VSLLEENECSVPMRYGNFIINMACHVMHSHSLKRTWHCQWKWGGQVANYFLFTFEQIVVKGINSLQVLNTPLSVVYGKS